MYVKVSIAVKKFKKYSKITNAHKNCRLLILGYLIEFKLDHSSSKVSQLFCQVLETKTLQFKFSNDKEKNQDLLNTTEYYVHRARIWAKKNGLSGVSGTRHWRKLLVSENCFSWTSEIRPGIGGWSVNRMSPALRNCPGIVTSCKINRHQFVWLYMWKEQISGNHN